MIIIKDMEMPKNCDVCFMHDSCEYSMPVGKRLSECPLTEVPTPHGRLIDADELFKEMERKGWYDNADRDIAEYLVLDAPTIIEAEEVYGQYTDTAGNFHWCGTHSGEHTIKAEEGET